MATILSVHSFRGGTGKSNTTANLAVVYARRGLRVGVIDTDILWFHAVTPDGASTAMATPIDVALDDGPRGRVDNAEDRVVIPTDGQPVTLTLSMSLNASG